MMSEVKCGACKKFFTCHGVNPRTKQLYKTCQTCRKRNTNSNQYWKAIVYFDARPQRRGKIVDNTGQCDRS